MKYTILLLVIISIGCGKKSATSNSESNSSNINEDSTTYIVDSAIGSVNSALNDSEHISSYALNRPVFPEIKKNIFESFYHFANADSCNLTRFSPTFGSGSCAGTVSNKTVTANFSNCTGGPANEFIFNGNITLTFDSSTTCNAWISGTSFPSNGNVTRTSSNFIRKNPNGSTVTTTSDSHSNYLNQTISGGAKTTFTVSNRTVDILGLHKIRKSTAGQTIFDHSVTSIAPLVVTGSKLTGNRQINSGTIKVDHNIARYSSTANLSGITWTQNCCHPTSGSITFQIVGLGNGNLVVDFSTGTCGTANVSLNSGPTQSIQLTSCE